MKICICCNLYNNIEEVVTFIKHISNDNPYEVDIYLNLNSRICEKDAAILSALKIVVIDFCGNKGYLNGLTCAVQAVKKSYDYIVYCNTDIILDTSFFDILAKKHYHYDIGCICPDVSLTNGRKQNPNMISRPSISKLKFLKTIYRYKYIGLIYILSSIVKSKFKNSNVIYGNCDIYGGHGSILIFSQSFIEILQNISFGALLQDEEIVIAEELRLNGFRCIYDTDLKVTHMYHGTIGKTSIMKYVKWHYDSLSFIIDKYF